MDTLILITGILCFLVFLGIVLFIVIEKVFLKKTENICNEKIRPNTKVRPSVKHRLETLERSKYN